MNELSQPILDAIASCVKATADGTIPPDVMTQTYQTEATAALAFGMSEADLIEKFKQMENES